MCSLKDHKNVYMDAYFLEHIKGCQTDHEHPEVRCIVFAIVGSVIRITTYIRQYRYTSAGNDLIIVID